MTSATKATGRSRCLSSCSSAATRNAKRIASFAMKCEGILSRPSRGAMIVLVVIMCAAIVAFIAIQTLRGLIPQGPTWAVGDGQHVWLLSHDNLHVLDAQGRRVAKVSLKEL